jgi:hypothetical protein
MRTAESLFRLAMLALMFFAVTGLGFGVILPAEFVCVVSFAVISVTFHEVMK